MLNEDEIARGFIKALKSDEGQQALQDAMAAKLEKTAGWDCANAKERAEIRKDMEFVRDLRLSARRGVDKAIWWILGTAGLGFIAWLGSKSGGFPLK